LPNRNDCTIFSTQSAVSVESQANCLDFVSCNRSSYYRM